MLGNAVTWYWAWALHRPHKDMSTTTPSAFAFLLDPILVALHALPLAVGLGP